ncbi:hypothetical protein QBC39DRAFT_431422 [Podospora conica]|nr:hypothetical protein QBC39DRAFT_431422 [Schizothecium conicum]
MCLTEYIAYHCGHRSPSVLRPCPLTTASPTFPPCTTQPTRQHNAATMCAACERTLHFRWVLIREWEHRWLHERGVCPCDVVFPGLLYRPRVSSASANGPAPAGQPAYAITGAGGDVAVRIPGLYAAEWVADHRALHARGGCKCPLDMAVVGEPAAREDEMGAGEVAVLGGYRGLEHPGGYDVDGGRARVEEITRLFGDVFLPTPRTVVEAFVPPAKRWGRKRNPNSFWLRDAQKSTTDRRVVYGSGPYWNVGYQYHDDAGKEEGGGKGKGKDTTAAGQQKMLCGLPMGCGPENIEGHHHVGEWERCKLFGSGTSIGRLSVAAKDGQDMMTPSTSAWGRGGRSEEEGTDGELNNRHGEESRYYPVFSDTEEEGKSGEEGHSGGETAFYSVFSENEEVKSGGEGVSANEGIANNGEQPSNGGEAFFHYPALSDTEEETQEETRITILTPRAGAVGRAMSI